MRKITLKVISLLFIATLLAACAPKKPDTPIGVVPRADTFTTHERSLSTKAKQGVFKQNKLWDNKTQRTRVKKIAQRLLAQVGTNDRWELYVLDSPTWNAATIGGTIFVWRGLLEDLTSDDELAFVMAHEVAHNLAKHSEQSSGEKFGKILTTGLTLGASILIQQQGGSAQIAQQGAQAVNAVGSGLFVNPFSQSDEYEADQIGIFLMADAGYDPGAAPRVWERQAKKGDSRAEFFSTHPASENRFQRLKSILEKAEVRYKAAKKKKKQYYSNIISPTVIR